MCHVILTLRKPAEILSFYDLHESMGRHITVLSPSPDGNFRTYQIETHQVQEIPVEYVYRDYRLSQRIDQSTNLFPLPTSDSPHNQINRLTQSYKKLAHGGPYRFSPAGRSTRSGRLSPLELMAQHLSGMYRRFMRTFYKTREGIPFTWHWESSFPELVDLSLTFTPIIQNLAPHCIHTIGTILLPVAICAIRNSGTNDISLIHDLRWGHYPDQNDSLTARQLAALKGIERAYKTFVDHTIIETSGNYIQHSRSDPNSLSTSIPMKAHHSSVANDSSQILSHVAIGVANHGGQGSLWMNALRGVSPNTRTSVLAIESYLKYPSDVLINRAQYEYDYRWAVDMMARARDKWSHIVIESGNPIFGCALGKAPYRDIAFFDQHSIQHALLFHGTDIRDPTLHAELHEWSPFREHPYGISSTSHGYWDSYYHLLRQRNRRLLLEYGGPVFVSTIDLLTYVDDAIWLPLVVDVPLFTKPRPARDRPLIIHASTNPSLKGTAYVESVGGRLQAAGLADVRILHHLPHVEILKMLQEADIVVDQLLLGGYGVFACEALAAGAIVIGYLGNKLRESMPDPIPIIEANPANLEEVLRSVISNIDELRSLIPNSHEYIRRWHDGTKSGQLLRRHLVEGPTAK